MFGFLFPEKPENSASYKQGHIDNLQSWLHSDLYDIANALNSGRDLPVWRVELLLVALGTTQNYMQQLRITEYDCMGWLFKLENGNIRLIKIK